MKNNFFKEVTFRNFFVVFHHSNKKNIQFEFKGEIGSLCEKLII